MDALINDLKSLSYIILPLIALVAWSIRLEQLVKGHGKQGDTHKSHIATLFTKLDSAHSDLRVLSAKAEIHGSMMSPEKQQAFWTDMAGMKKDIEHLKSDRTDRRREGKK